MPLPSSRKLRSGVAIGLAAVIFVAVVLLADTALRGYRVDLTQDRLYTISPQTQKILGRIDEPITLTFYFSRDAAQGVPFVSQYADRVHELLEEYVAYSGGKLKLRTVDPRPLTQARDQATKYGLKPMSAGDGNDARIFLGLVGTNSTDGLETIKFFDPERERFLEYDISRMIWSLMHPEKPVVGIVSTLHMTSSVNPATGRKSPSWTIIDRLRQIADVRHVETPTDHIDPDIDVLMLVHPHGYDNDTLYAIDQYLTHGGRAAVFLDPVAYTRSGRTRDGKVHRSRSDPGPLLKAWGVDVTLDRAFADPQHGLVVNAGEDIGRVVHPGLIGVTKGGINGHDVITATLERLVFGAPGAITDPPGGLEVTPLVTSANSGALLPADRFASVDNPADLAEGLKSDGTLHTLVARLDGDLRSAWPDGPPPGATAPPEGHLAAAAKPAHMVLFADTDLLSDRLWVQEQQTQQGLVRRAWSDDGDLVVNAIQSLTGSDALINIRGEGTSARPFTRVDALKRAAADRFREKEHELRQALKKTEARLDALRSGKDDGGGGVILSDQQRAELEHYRQRRIELRQALRTVKQRLDAEIDALGTRLKLLNILAVPVLVGLAALVVFGFRRRRRRRAAPGTP